MPKKIKEKEAAGIQTSSESGRLARNEAGDDECRGSLW
jgi:hypothetical protein